MLSRKRSTMEVAMAFSSAESSWRNLAGSPSARAGLKKWGDVFDISAAVLEWSRAGKRTVLARTVDVQGFSARWPQDGLAASATDRAGHVLGGAAASALGPILDDALAHDRAAAVHELRVSDAEAGAA